MVEDDADHVTGRPDVSAWTVADIDGGIPIIAAKLREAKGRGDIEAMAAHLGWINRLLDMRTTLRTKGLG